MSILHTISKPPSSGLLESCLPLLKAGDCVLFIEDGVFHCINSNQLVDGNLGVKFCALTEDLEARGLRNRVTPLFSVTNTPGFVELCVRFDKIVNWF